MDKKVEKSKRKTKLDLGPAGPSNRTKKTKIAKEPSEKTKTKAKTKAKTKQASPDLGSESPETEYTKTSDILFDDDTDMRLLLLSLFAHDPCHDFYEESRTLKHPSDKGKNILD